MGIKDSLDDLWVLKICVWCKKHILPEDLDQTTDPELGGNVWFQHRGPCPEIDPLARRA